MVGKIVQNADIEDFILMLRLKTPQYRCQNLGNGRVKFTIIVNFKVIGLIIHILLGLALLGFVLYWLGVGLAKKN